MVRCIKLIFLIFILFGLFFENVFSLESAAHKAEETKCIIISSLVRNSNLVSKDFNDLAAGIYKKTQIKANSLEISELSVNEMKKEVENTLSQLIDQKNFSRIKKLLEYCIQTLKIGS